jgi:hypothetical protein
MHAACSINIEQQHFNGMHGFQSYAPKSAARSAKHQRSNKNQRSIKHHERPLDIMSTCCDSM